MQECSDLCHEGNQIVEQATFKFKRKDHADNFAYIFEEAGYNAFVDQISELWQVEVSAFINLSADQKDFQRVLKKAMKIIVD